MSLCQDFTFYPEGLSNLKLPAPELVLEFNFLSNRVLWLEGDVTEYFLEYLKYIVQWNLEDADAPVEQRNPIKIFFNSPGGYLDVGFSLIDVISMSKTPVIGVNIGQCLSAAACIFTACHKRYMFPNSYFLYHAGSGDIAGTHQQVQAQMWDYEEKVKGMKEFLFSNLKNIDNEEFEKKFNGEWYIYRDEALKLGLCDKVVSNIEDIL